MKKGAKDRQGEKLRERERENGREREWVRESTKTCHGCGKEKQRSKINCDLEHEAGGVNDSRLFIQISPRQSEIKFPLTSFGHLRFGGESSFPDICLGVVAVAVAVAAVG